MTDLQDINGEVTSPSLIQSHLDKHLLPQASLTVTRLTREMSLPPRTGEMSLPSIELLGSFVKGWAIELRISVETESWFIQILSLGLLQFEPVAKSQETRVMDENAEPHLLKEREGMGTHSLTTHCVHAMGEA